MYLCWAIPSKPAAHPPQLALLRCIRSLQPLAHANPSVKTAIRPHSSSMPLPPTHPPALSPGATEGDTAVGPALFGLTLSYTNFTAMFCDIDIGPPCSEETGDALAACVQEEVRRRWVKCSSPLPHVSGMSHAGRGGVLRDSSAPYTLPHVRAASSTALRPCHLRPHRPLHPRGLWPHAAAVGPASLGNPCITYATWGRPSYFPPEGLTLAYMKSPPNSFAPVPQPPAAPTSCVPESGRRDPGLLAAAASYLAISRPAATALRPWWPRSPAK